MLCTVPGFIFTVPADTAAIFIGVAHTLTLRLVANKWVLGSCCEGVLAFVAYLICCWSRVLFYVSSDDKAAGVKCWVLIPAC